MTINDLPAINASLNFLSTIFISAGWFYIRRNVWQRHVPCMIAAIISSSETIQNLDKFRAIQAKLSDPRALTTDLEAARAVKEGKPVALVKVDNLLYQVRAGNYLGQNYGKITKVGETDVTLREIVQDAGGEWIERVAKLQLQERSK